MAEAPIVQSIRVRGELLLRLEGSDVLHPVGTIEQDVQVTIVASQYPDEVMAQMHKFTAPRVPAVGSTPEGQKDA